MDYRTKYIGFPDDYDEKLAVPKDDEYLLPDAEFRSLRAAADELIEKHRVLFPEATIKHVQRLAYLYIDKSLTARGAITLLQAACEYVNAPRRKIYTYVDMKKYIMKLERKLNLKRAKPKWLCLTTRITIRRLEKKLYGLRIALDLLWNTLVVEFEALPKRVVEVSKNHLIKYNYMNLRLQDKTLNPQEQEDLNLFLAAGLEKIGIRENFKSKISIRHTILIDALVHMLRPQLWGLLATSQPQFSRKLKLGLTGAAEDIKPAANVICAALKGHPRVLQTVPAPTFLLLAFRSQNLTLIIQAMSENILGEPQGYLHLDFANYRQQDVDALLEGCYGGVECTTRGELVSYLEERSNKGLVFITNWLGACPQFAQKIEESLRTGYYTCKSIKKKWNNRIFSGRSDRQAIDIRGVCFIFGHVLQIQGTNEEFNSIMKEVPVFKRREKRRPGTDQGRGSGLTKQDGSSTPSSKGTKTLGKDKAKELNKMKQDETKKALEPLVHKYLEQEYIRMRESPWATCLSFINKDILIDLPGFGSLEVPTNGEEDRTQTAEGMKNGVLPAKEKGDTGATNIGSNGSTSLLNSGNDASTGYNSPIKEKQEPQPESAASLFTKKLTTMLGQKIQQGVTESINGDR